MTSNKMLVVLNPSAGIAAPQVEAVHELANLYAANVITSSTVAELTRLLATAVDKGVRRIVVAGGDGSVSLVVNALPTDVLSEVELGITPLGTGNDLARSLDLPLDDVEMAFVLAATHPAIPIDLVRMRHEQESYFVNAATAGFGADVTAALTAESKHLWGAFAYWLTATSQLVDPHPYNIDLRIDGETLSAPAFGLTLANGRYIGGGFPVASQALLDDGLLNLVLIPVLEPLDLMAAGVEYLMGWNAPGSGIVARQARQVEIRAVPRMRFSLDGEPTRALDAMVEVVPRKLQVVPGESPAVESRTVTLVPPEN